VSVALAGLCALIAIAASLSLWWFAIGACALLAWLHLESPCAEDHIRTPTSLRLSTATIVSLACYALLLSIALLTVRAALGLLELPVVPFEHAWLAPGMQHASVGYYDKSELRLGLLELLALSVAFTIVFVRLANHWVLQRRQPLAMHPLSAAFAFVLYFASVRLPPYPIDLDYWHPLVAAATGIQPGEWRSLVGDSTQGWLRPHLLALWLSAFGLSALSLSAVATICSVAAGTASFALLRRLTGSRAVALLGTSYLLLEATATHADRLAFPAPAHVALALLTLYLSLRLRGQRTWPAFLFGLIVAWDPLFGAFAAVGFLLAHGGQMLQFRNEVPATRVRALFAMGAGIGVSLVAVLVLHGSLAWSTPQTDVTPVLHEIVVLRPDRPALESALPFLALLVPLLLFLALTPRKHGSLRQWSARRIFAGASLLCAIPYAFLAAASEDPRYWYSIQWALLPAATLALYGPVRAICLNRRLGTPSRFRAALSLGMSALLLVVCFDVFFPIDPLNRVVARYATAYESERATWYRQCAAGLACDAGAKPTLAHYVRDASRPFAPQGEARRGR
jgi:hypothetical protein